MRPKKRILLACALEDRSSILRYLLVTYAYAVTSVEAAEDALAEMAEKPFDLVIIDWPFDGCERLLNAARDLERPSLVIASRERIAPFNLVADAVITKCNFPAEVLLDYVKRVTIRRRGPKPLKKLPAIAPAEMTSLGAASA